MSFRLALTALAVALLALPLAGATVYQTPVPDLAALVDAPLTPAVSVSPDDKHLLLMTRPPLPTIAELAEPELRLAGIRINPNNFAPSRTRPYDGLALVAVADGAQRAVQGLPKQPRIRNVAWSPDARHVAFTHDVVSRVELWILSVADGKARRLGNVAVNDAHPGAALHWAPDSRSLLVKLVPEKRAKAPAALSVPAGPVVQETAGRSAPAPTFQDLLQNAHDEALFEHYATSDLARVELSGSFRPLGHRRIVADFEPSPDGRFILLETLHRPFSYLVPWYRFPRRVDVLDATGAVVKAIADLPLHEDVPLGFGSVPKGMRAVSWRADAPATLFWVEALDEGDARKKAEWRDRLFLLPEPFSSEPIALASLPLRLDEVWWGDGDLALVEEWWWSDRKRRIYAIDPSNPGSAPRVLFDVSFEDRYANPGSPVRRTDSRGREVLALEPDGDFYLIGEGGSPEGDRPFLRRYDLESGTTAELFRSAAPRFEQPLAFLDPARQLLLTRSESTDTPPNYFARDLARNAARPLTDFPHPYPELKDIQKELITYRRSDGVPLSATLYLPAGYDAEKDGPLPGLVWAYPDEFKSADAAGQIQDSPHRFNTVSYWAPVPFVTRGYAVFADAAMPVIGEGEVEPNDRFVDQLTMNAKAVIDEGVRRGVLDPKRVAVGGHSYGAFMAANLLAHTNLFRTAIARSGAYNRSLTPFGFQAEERTFWEAPQTYFTMSPFMNAEKIDEPILLIHGEADNNSGTFPMQSERLFNAIKGLGGTARLVVLPHESHGYRARESLLHMLWEMDRWLEAHVKGAAASGGS